MNRYIIVSIMLWFGVILVGCSALFDESKITSFEDCVAAGNPIMESYPAKCSDGKDTFTQKINSSNLEENSFEKICTMEYNPVCGVDNITYSNKCMAGVIEIAYNGSCELEENIITDSYGNIVPSSCTSWYDGCNNCRISENGLLMCTKMFCEELNQATCLDE